MSRIRGWFLFFATLTTVFGESISDRRFGVEAKVNSDGTYVVNWLPARWSFGGKVSACGNITDGCSMPGDIFP